MPHPVLFASISGAHLYGFASPDSDVDLRGCHVLPLRQMLGLGEPTATISRTWQVDGVEIDLVSHDLKKFALLLRRQNGNFLEQLLAPTVVVDTPWAEELRDLTRRSGITRHVYHSYAGYAWLHNPPDHQPEPAKFGARRHAKGDFRFPDTHQERAFRATLKHWQNYQDWRANRNPARAAISRL